MIRAFLITGSPLARFDLENLLRGASVQITGAAESLDSANSFLADTEADVVLIDTNGEDLQHLLHSLAESGVAADFPVVILDDRNPGISLDGALRSGVRAVLPRNLAPDQLVSALQAAASGLVVMHPQAIEAFAPASRPLAELTETLTRREREVLQMLAAGLGNKEIAFRLSISDHTVKFHVASVLGKLGAQTRTQAVSLAIRHGLILL